MLRTPNSSSDWRAPWKARKPTCAELRGPAVPIATAELQTKMRIMTLHVRIEVGGHRDRAAHEQIL